MIIMAQVKTSAIMAATTPLKLIYKTFPKLPKILGVR
jgi:hypothetical protein